MKSNSPINIYQNKKGITFLDGFYLARNPRTGAINILAISKGRVYIHDPTRHISLQDLVNLDSSGFLDVFETLKLTELEKYKNKTKK